MVDKKIVDDYYSNITSDKVSNNKGADLTKKKIRIKTKKVIKKKVEIDIEKETFINKLKKEDKPQQFKKIIETIPIIKKRDNLRKVVKLKTNTDNKTRIIQRRPVDPKKAKYSSESKSFRTPLSRIESSKNNTSNNKSVLKKVDKPKKVFTNNKTKSTFTSKNIQVNKTGKSINPGNKKIKFTAGKTRGRFKYSEKEEDLTFSRSLKVNKKEEKKVEDIKQNLIDRTGSIVIVPDILSLKEFSEKIGVPLIKLIAEFMKNGMMVNINSKVDFDSASVIAEGFDIKLEKDESLGINIKDILSGKLDELLIGDDIEKLKERPPVISIMGHVDHGKTSILDSIRKSKITSGEAGGITQSIGAYQVSREGKKITFLDTPGHEAFTIMRARGAKSTDIAVLVVAADEGVKPQTIESINHAKEADIPVIVAINKMDKEGANPDYVKGQLAENGLSPEEWGGDTPMVPVSAQTGFGIDELLEMILLVSEMKELKANPDRLGVATVIESHLDLKLGPVATVLVNTGNIKKGDNIVCAESFGKVKILKNFESKNILNALPGDPILIVGLDNIVEGGDIMQVLPTIDIAKSKAFEYSNIINNNKNLKLSGLDILMSKIKTGNLKQLKIVLKSDTKGSLEAMKSSLEKISTNETNVVIIHSGVGGITESDVIMCEGSSAILVGFGVDVLSTAKGHLENSNIEFINNKIIYHITDRIDKIVKGMLDTKEVETVLGIPKVLEVFYTSKEFMVVGLLLKEGERVEPKSLVRVIRNKKIVGTGKVLSMKQGVEEVKFLEGPIECGVKFSGDIILEIKDELEIYKIEVHN